MFLNYGEVGNNIKAMLEQFQGQVENQRKMESIKDMKNFFEQYPEFKRLSGTVNRHVVLLGELSRLISTHKLFDISEIEQELASHGNLADALKVFY
jgi:vacuolar protein sorting-associated protein 45